MNGDKNLPRSINQLNQLVNTLNNVSRLMTSVNTHPYTNIDEHDMILIQNLKNKYGGKLSTVFKQYEVDNAVFITEVKQLTQELSDESKTES